MTDLPPPPPPPSQPPGPPGPPGGGFGDYGGGYGEPYGAPATPVKVGPWPRFGARILDALILLIPNVIVAAAVGGGYGTLGEMDGADYGAQVLTTVISIGYYVWMESTYGATLGKRMLGMVVLGPQGGNPTTEQALRRNAWSALGVIPFLGSLVVFIFSIVIATSISGDPAGRGPHDRFAGGTMVTRR